jgi:hypothetical protein
VEAVAVTVLGLGVVSIRKVMMVNQTGREHGSVTGVVVPVNEVALTPVELVVTDLLGLVMV